MDRNPLSSIDDLDSRREILRLLELLFPREREWFLSEVGRQLVPPVTCANTTMTPNESYIDLLALIGQYDIPVKMILTALEQFVRGRTAMTISARHSG